MILYDNLLSGILKTTTKKPLFFLSGMGKVSDFNLVSGVGRVSDITSWYQGWVEYETTLVSGVDRVSYFTLVLGVCRVSDFTLV